MTAQTYSVPEAASADLDAVAAECLKRKMFPSSWMDEMERDSKTPAEFIREHASALAERESHGLPFFLPAEKPRLEAFIAGWLMKGQSEMTSALDV